RDDNRILLRVPGALAEIEPGDVGWRWWPAVAFGLAQRADACVGLRAYRGFTGGDAGVGTGRVADLGARFGQLHQGRVTRLLDIFDGQRGFNLGVAADIHATVGAEAERELGDEEGDDREEEEQSHRADVTHPAA